MKYSEDILRRAAVNEEGKPCEILERITYARAEQPDGALGEPQVVSRRFDLKTGERVNHLGGDDYQLDESGVRLRAQG